MKLLTTLLLISSCPIHYLSAQINHAYQAQKIPAINSDSLIFEKAQSKKGKSIAIKRGIQVKAKKISVRAIKGFVHAFSSDSLEIITRKGLVSISLTDLKFLIVYHGLKKQTISSELISKGTLIAIPATIGLALSIRESFTQGDLEKQFYQATAILGIPATALIVAGSMIRRKKLRMSKWSIPSS